MTKSRWTRRQLFGGAGVLGGAFLLSACSSDKESKDGGPKARGDGPRPLTNAEATAMAGVLFDNLTAKGATFNYAGKLTGDDQLSMSGEVDWEHHVGHALVQSKVAEAKVTEIFWNERLVAERRPSLTRLLVQLGRQPHDFFVRPPAVDTRELDQAIAVIMGLASQQRDNPQLIRQAEGSSFIRTDTLHGTPVNVLRYGPRNSYWIAQTDGALLRLEANSANGLRPRVVDLIARGPQTITPPDGKVVVEGATLGDLWSADNG